MSSSQAPRYARLKRRDFLRAGAAAGALGALTLPAAAAILTGRPRIRIGFLSPLTGDVAPWGLPGLYGCALWAERANATGIDIAGTRYDVEFVSFDDHYTAEAAAEGARKLILRDEVKFVMMLGGDTWPGAAPLAAEHDMLFSTLLPSDLSAQTSTLIAPCEVHPVYNVTGVWWLAEQRPELRDAVLCAQDDALGLPSIATYRAAFEAHGIEVLETVLYPGDTTDFAPIMEQMLTHRPDILCFDTAYTPAVHALCEAAYHQGFKGQILSCTADAYPEIAKRTSWEFLEGLVFQFPDFDDPRMQGAHINFLDPAGFYRDYLRRWPADWSAVSWEYASIMDLWVEGAQRAGSIEPLAVLDGMRRGGVAKHAFGAARWWGQEIFGIDHALIGNWPVVAITEGQARIQEFKNIPQWWQEHGEVLSRHLNA